MRLIEYSELGEKVYHETLDNGLNIYIVDKPAYVNSYACFMTNYGGSDRRFKLDGKWLDTPAGVAHFLEHKLFDMPDGSNTLLKLSANGASPNAYTSDSVTNYHFTCAENFEDNLRTLLEYVTTPYFTRESVQKEQGIITQEIKMGEDDPSSMGYLDLRKMLYLNNPARDSVCGTIESIAEITPETLYDCHKVFYNPSNMVLAAAGALDAQRVADIAREIVKAGAGEIPQRDYGAAEKELPHKTFSERKMEVSAPLFSMGAKLIIDEVRGDKYWKQLYIASFACAYMASRASDLYVRMYKNGLINKNFSFGLSYFPAGAIIGAYGESSEPEKILDEINKEAQKIASGKFDSKLFSGLKNSIIGDSIRSTESVNIANSVAFCHFTDFTPFRNLEMYRSITEDDVKCFIADNIKAERFATALVKPLK